MTPEEAIKFVKGYVRVRPTGSRRHHSRARLLELIGDKAVIQPFGHRIPVTVPVELLTTWKGGNPEMYAQKRRPLPIDHSQPLPQEETAVATEPVQALTAPPQPIELTFSPELCKEAMDALKELSDAEQMARVAMADVVKARQKWIDVKARLDTAERKA